MYWEYFGFDENPFSIAPDPRFLFMSSRHQEALAHLVYGIGEGGGFVLLTGEVGTGKTTLCRSLIERLPDNVDLAFVLNPRVNEVELLETICDEMGVAYPRDRPPLKLLVDRLNEHLLAAHARGRQPVLLIDEAQALSPAVLEQVRLLTNLETTTRKLLKIVLIGQPELRDMLRWSGLRQLDQRITARYHLAPLGAEETAGYIRHRLEVAGAQREVFTPRAIRAVHRHSGGVPRLINTLCDRALLGAYAENRSMVDAHLVRGAAREVIGGARHGARSRWRLAAAGLGGVAVAAVVAAGPLGVHLTPVGAPKTAPAVEPAVASSALETPLPSPDPPAPPMDDASAEAADADDGEPVEDVDTAAGPMLAAAQAVALEPQGDSAPAPARPADGITVSLLPPPPPPPFPAMAPADEIVPAAASAHAPVLPASEPPPSPPAPAVVAAVVPPAPELNPGVSAPVPPSLDDLLGQPELVADIAAAVADVLAAWDYDYDKLKGVNPCKKARYADLLCHEGNAGWHELRVVNLPAVMTLRVGDRRIYAALIGLGDETAEVVIGGQTVATTAAALSQHWTGDYLVLWRPLFDYQRELWPGMTGGDVAWLKDRLAELRDEAPRGEASAAYDDALTERVRAFQRAHDLSVDGVAGPRTLIQLGRMLPGAQAPNLR